MESLGLAVLAPVYYRCILSRGCRRSRPPAILVGYRGPYCAELESDRDAWAELDAAALLHVGVGVSRA